MSAHSGIHPALDPWIELGLLLGVEVGRGAMKALSDLQPRRRGSYRVRRPGGESPLWNKLAAAVRAEVQASGAKVRLARYLGLPRQRLHDFLNSRTRLPDAEVALQLLYWLAAKRQGRDLSI